MLRSWWHRLLPSHAPPDDHEIGQIKQASAQQLHTARKQSREAQEIGAHIARERQRNHFGELIWRALGGDRHDRL